MPDEFSVEDLRTELTTRSLGDFSTFKSIDANLLKELSDALKLNSNEVIRHVNAFVFPLLSGEDKLWNGRLWMVK
jgi:hypothetical protein